MRKALPRPLEAYQSSTIVLGLSGGPDSVYLLHKLLHEAQVPAEQIIAAHLDHQWRSGSENDAEFCKNLCQQWGVRFVDARLSELDIILPRRGSQEEKGRIARRYFLQQVRKQYNADVIMLAHHLQDQQETFLMRLVRGSSLAGLCCMQEQSGVYVRPLLHTTREQIMEYLNTHQIPYLHDPSNESEQFLRNRIRAQVLPALRGVDKRFDANFQTTLSRLQETEQWIESIVEQTWLTITTPRADTTALRIKDFLRLPKPLRDRILMRWLVHAQISYTPSQALFTEIERFLQRPGSKQHLLGPAWSIEKTPTLAWIITST